MSDEQSRKSFGLSPFLFRGFFSCFLIAMAILIVWLWSLSVIHSTFTPERWAKADAVNRGDMAPDLLAKHQSFVGMTRDNIHKLLGDPDIDRQIVGEMAGLLGYYVGSNQMLYVWFGDDGIVERAIIQEYSPG